MSPKKVFVIDDPAQVATPTPNYRPRPKSAAPASRPKDHVEVTPTGYSWLRTLRAYALGPINLLFAPGHRIWMVVGSAAIASLVMLLLGWSSLLSELQSHARGPLVLIGAVVLTSMLVSTAWARSVMTCKRGEKWPGWLRTSGAVCTLGLFFPGLGLLIVGRRFQAAIAIWCAGLLFAAAVVVKNWHWLAAAGDGPVFESVERILVAAVIAVAVTSIAWLAFAFEGLRAVSPDRRSGFLANALALVMVVTIATFFLTFQPAPIARDLGLAAAPLRHAGLRVIPLALYDTAAALDPGTPGYLAEAAAISEELGRDQEAQKRRMLLESRAAQFAAVVGERSSDVQESAMEMPLATPFDYAADPQPPLYLSWPEMPR